MKQFALRLAVIAVTLSIGLAAATLWPGKFTSPKKCFDEPYFPVGVFNLETNRMDWVTEYYSAMQEQPLSCIGRDVEVYRLLFVPSSESPASISVWREGERGYIELRQLHNVGTPQYGAKDMKLTVARPLTKEEWDRFQELLRETNFWSMPTEDGRPIGLDGANFLLEGKKAGKHHVVTRWFPEDQNFINACGYLLEISGRTPNE